jgi:hypothetical protein
MFRRIGARRYEIVVERERAPQLVMHPAIGWDDHLPHDLLRFVAEAEWGIDDGILGQVAAGGDAGTFVPTEHGLPRQEGRHMHAAARRTRRDRHSRLR